MHVISAENKKLFQPATVLAITISFLFAYLLLFLVAAGNGVPVFQLRDIFFRIRYSLKGPEEIFPYLVHLDSGQDAEGEPVLSPGDRDVPARIIALLAGTEAYSLFLDLLPVSPDTALAHAAGQAGNVFFPVILLPQNKAAAGKGLPSLSNLPAGGIDPPGSNGIFPEQLLWYPRVLRKGDPPRAAYLELPPAPVLQAARGLGHTTCVPDPDGINRSFPLLFAYKDGYIPCIALLLVCDFLQVNPAEIEVTFGRELVLKNAVYPAGFHKDIVVPIDSRGRLQINFSGPWGEGFLHYSAGRLLEAENDAALKQVLKNEVDQFIFFISDNSPRNAGYYPGIFGSFYPYIHLHSQVANTLLQQVFLRPASFPLRLLTPLLLIFFLYLAAIRSRLPVFTLVSLAVWMVLVLENFFLFCFRGILPFLSAPSLGMLVAVLSVDLQKWLIREKEALGYKLRLEAGRQVAVLNRKLAAKNRQLRELDAFKTRFFQNLTHEFRTPLTLILGPLATILDSYRQQLPGPVGKQLTVVSRNARRMLNLIDQLLELARLDKAALKRQFCEVELGPLLEELLAPFRLLAEKQEIRLSFRKPAPPVFLYADSSRLEKVILNLLMNAFRFCSAGDTIELSYSLPESLPGSRVPAENRIIEKVVKIEVRDTGPGIAAEVLPRIFTRFYQSGRGGGTGIGLSLAKEYVALHFGRIDVRSRTGEGTSFLIELPWGKAHLGPQEIIAGGQTPPARSAPIPLALDSTLREESTPQAVKYGKILIVEDDLEVAFFIKGILEDEYSVYLATDGEAGLKQAREIIPDLVLTDMRLPHMDGNAFICALKQEGPCADIPSILITALPEEELLHLSSRSVPDDFMSKPFLPAELKARVRRLMLLSRQNRQQGQTGQELTSVQAGQVVEVPEGGFYPAVPVLIVDDEEEVLHTYSFALNAVGINNLVLCPDSRRVSAILSSRSISVVLLDLRMPHITGQEVLDRIREEYPGIPVIISTAAAEIEQAVTCIRRGACDYLVKPVEQKRLQLALEQALELTRLKREVKQLKQGILTRELRNPEIFHDIIAASEKMKAIFLYMEAVATSPRPVLITGESGVGKELIAAAIHRLSGRGGKFVPLNVAGLDNTFFSDTLFGHKKGAFTGADSGRQGLIGQAEGGTLFLDEIGDLQPASQVKLLRLLQEREYFPLGSDKACLSTARVIVATNADLKSLQNEGLFRPDLYYRLLTHHIEVPPLRERLAADLPLLIEHFLSEAARVLSKRKPTAPPELCQLLATYSFPGNVRELQAIIFDAVSRHKAGVLSLEYFKTYLDKNRPPGKPLLIQESVEARITYLDRLPTLEEVETFFIREAMRIAGGKISLAAHLLGVARSTLSRKLKQLKESEGKNR